MGEADADEPRRALRPVHPGGEIAAIGLAGEHGRQQHGGIAERHRCRRQMQVYVVRRAGRRHPVPDALRPVRVVVAGDHVPGDAREGSHPLQRLAQGLRRRRLAVVDVAGDEDVAGLLGHREAARSPRWRRAAPASAPPSRSPNCRNGLPICQSAVWMKRMGPRLVAAAGLVARPSGLADPVRRGDSRRIGPAGRGRVKARRHRRKHLRRPHPRGRDNAALAASSYECMNCPPTAPAAGRSSPPNAAATLARCATSPSRLPRTPPACRTIRPSPRPSPRRSPATASACCSPRALPSMVLLACEDAGLRQYTYRTENAGAAMADGFARIANRVTRGDGAERPGGDAARAGPRRGAEVVGAGRRAGAGRPPQGDGPQRLPGPRPHGAVPGRGEVDPPRFGALAHRRLHRHGVHRRHQRAPRPGRADAAGRPFARRRAAAREARAGPTSAPSRSTACCPPPTGSTRRRN